MRELQKHSTALCNLSLYSNYLLVISTHHGCTKLANGMETMSHDAVLNHLDSYQKEQDPLQKISLKTFEKAHQEHWHIEEYHRAIKQLCNTEKFMVRRTIAVKTRFFSALWAFITLEEKIINNIITNGYKFREK